MKNFKMNSCDLIKHKKTKTLVTIDALAGLSEKRREVGGGLFGRQKGKRLRDEQQSLMETLLPKLQIENIQPILNEKIAELINPNTLFSSKYDELHLEIGFGGSEHLIHRATECPHIGFIGVEPFVNGVAKAVSEIARRDIKNIRLHHGDAVDLLACLPDGCISKIYLLYPDPWPKRRQRKRRFVSMPTLKALHRVLKANGEFSFASDIDDYVGWTLGMVKDSRLFNWLANTASDWQTPYENWPGTRYEAKAYREGRVPSYLRFVKL
jgi:tRNA (guanine-N7-)-methyltransferase